MLPSRMRFWPGEGRWVRMPAGAISLCVEPWVSEAAALDDIMPRASYSMVIDGDPLRDLSSEVFEEVKHDVAWQLATEKYLEVRHAGQVPLRRWRQHNGYLSEAMPRAIEEIVAGKSSIIRCNFETGDADAWPVEDMLQRFHFLDENDICFAHTRFTNPRPDGCYETEPPLPTWQEIHASQILPGPEPRKRREDRRTDRRIMELLSYF